MSTGSISRFVLSHKLLVAFAWLVIFVLSVALIGPAINRLSDDFTSPGTESYDANVQILATYNGTGGITDPVVAVVDLPDGTTVESPGVREELDAAMGRVQEAMPPARIVSWASTGDPALVSEDGGTTFALIYLPPDGQSVAGLPVIEAALDGATVGGAEILLTGRPVMSEGSDEDEGSGVLIEILIGATGALLVLAWIFGSLLALLPLFMAGISILASFLVIGGIASITSISEIVQYLVSLIGLGIAIDYSLLIVSRWREERQAGYDNELAVQRAMETAGHAVVFSGTTVAIGLLALILIPVNLLRGIGIGGMIIPLVSVLISITLLPVVLATVGPKIDWPRNRRSHVGGDGWVRWTRWVVEHRWPAAIIATLIMGALLIPAANLNLGAPRPDALEGPSRAHTALDALETSGINAGVFSPYEIVTRGDAGAVAEAVTNVDGVRGAIAPEAWQTDGTSLVVVLPQNNGSGSEITALLPDIREAAHSVDAEALVGGSIASDGDFIDTAYGSLWWTISLIALITFVLLVRAFRSVILPLKAIILNIISVAASFGVVVMVWQWGWGSEQIWGIPSTGSITSWIPIAIFAFLYGISMDYEVFILARMREEYDGIGDNDEAIVRGLGVTGRLVTSAALILFFAFAALAAGPGPELKSLATGLAAGVILDATVVRALLVPALVSLMGHWNWWLPSWLEWLAPKPGPITGDAKADTAAQI
jgi:RND superfamily putative drug exporter